MTENKKLDSVTFNHIRPEYVDFGHKSGSPRIREISHFLSCLLVESPELVPGPASEVFEELEETTASRFANETNRVLRLTANLTSGPMEFDIVIYEAAPTHFTYSDEREG